MKKQKEKKEYYPILNQVLTAEFLKQFKHSGELNSFMEQLYARAMEQMLEGEMDGHLGYENILQKESPLEIHANGKTARQSRLHLERSILKSPEIVMVVLNQCLFPNAAIR